MHSNEPPFSACRELEPGSPPSTSSLQMRLDLEIPAVARAPRLADSETTFHALYREWYLEFQRNPVLAGPPPVPYTRPAVSAPALPPDTRAYYSPPPIGKSLTAKLEAYDGIKEKYVQWWRTVRLYIAGFDVEPTDQQKILIALSYMTGNNAAGRFADLYFMQGLLASSTFDAFKAKLDAAFRPASLQRIAEGKLFKSCQDKETAEDFVVHMKHPIPEADYHTNTHSRLHIQRIAEGKLFKLRQDKETVEDFVVHMRQLILEAGYDTNTYSRFLINILRNGIRNEVVEFVERSQPELINSHSFAQWESALVRADQVLSEIAERKRTRNLGAGTPPFTPRNIPSKTSSTTAPSVPSSSQSSAKADIHPNQPGTFGGVGVLMDISKARAEGKCAKCGGPWPCATRARPRRNARFV
ncbi:hypothetical protein HD554DRAFT_2171219 [Boletus coccyginus]|nr:hypothetical protein HD554DRAFT_2171219 [Boletus coccyginus]